MVAIGCHLIVGGKVPELVLAAVPHSPEKNRVVSKDQQVTRAHTRQQSKPLTRRQSEQRRNDA